MAWITITEDHILTAMTGAELEKIRVAATRTGQVDPVQPTITEVTDLVRGYVGACAKNLLGDGKTIPEKLLAPAIDIIAFRINKRVMSTPKARQEAAEQAIKLLEQVAKCMFDIEEPTVPEDDKNEQAQGFASPSISTSKTQFGRGSLDGL